MNTFTKKDLLSCLITGLTTGIVAWQVLNFLKAPSFGLPTAHPHAFFIVIVPVLWVIGVNLGYFLGRWIPFFNQFGKYAAIGFTNAAVDFGVLNLLIAYSGVAEGLIFSIFKTISFIVAVVHSYIWNRSWAFSSQGSRPVGEMAKFFIVNIIVAGLNVGISSLVVNFVDPRFGLDANTWANVGAVIGSAMALAFNFIGFKLIVFKKNDDSLSKIPPTNL